MFRDTPPITKNLIIINVLVYMAQLVFEQRGTDLASLAGLHYVLAGDFHVFQFFTYMFLHGSLTHLFFNMFSLWRFGRIIERTMGPRRFLLYYFVCGVGAGLCQELWQTGEYFMEGLADYQWVNIGGALLPVGEYLNYWTTIGASGACYGILLAFGMTFPEERLMLLIPPIPVKAKYFVVGYAAIELFAAFGSDSNIAHFAHLGGMLFGLLLILWWRRKDRNPGGGFDGWDTWRPQRRRSMWTDLKDRLLRLSPRRPRMEVRKGSGTAFKDRGDDYDFNLHRREREERIDRILDKIKRSGYDSLSEAEKQELFQNSRK